MNRITELPELGQTSAASPEQLFVSKLAKPNIHAKTNGNGTGNLLLHRAEKAESSVISAALELVRLNPHQMLHEAGEVIKSVYFLNDGLASVLAVQPDGKSVEVGVIGKEGFVGFPVVFGFKTSSGRVVTQCEGTAHRIEASKLKSLLLKCPKLALSMQRYAVMLSAQSTQLAACNRLHEVDERLARWLLMSHDRVGSVTMPLTQDFLAQMLGTRRSTVSTSASILQKAGMITYTRGNVTIVDRNKLEQASCDCYRLIQQQIRSWKEEAV